MTDPNIPSPLEFLLDPPLILACLSTVIKVNFDIVFKLPGCEQVADVPAAGQVVHQEVHARVDGQKQVGHLNQPGNQLKKFIDLSFFTFYVDYLAFLGAKMKN